MIAAISNNLNCSTFEKGPKTISFNNVRLCSQSKTGNIQNRKSAAPQRQPSSSSACVCVGDFGHRNTVETWHHSVGTFHDGEYLCILLHSDLQSLD